MRARLLWAIYLIGALVALMMWTRANINLISGDEPHYLIMASGIVKHGTFEQTLPYKEEFANKGNRPVWPAASRRFIFT
jgi:hypothetical protein